MDRTRAATELPDHLLEQAEQLVRPSSAASMASAEAAQQNRALPRGQAPAYEAVAQQDENDAEEESHATGPSLTQPSPPLSTGATTVAAKHGKKNGAAGRSKPVQTQDGVFANLNVAPSTPQPSQPAASSSSSERAAAGAGGLPSRPTSTNEKLPDYNDIANDRVPSYFETVVIAPAHLLSGQTAEQQDANVFLVDGLEVGSLLHYALTAFITAILGFIGFFITYTFSNTHAGRAGAQTGFGIFVIRYAFTLFERVQAMIDALIAEGISADDAAAKYSGHSIAINLMVVFGWVLIFSAISNYIRAARTLVLQLATSSSMV